MTYTHRHAQLDKQPEYFQPEQQSLQASVCYLNQQLLSKSLSPQTISCCFGISSYLDFYCYPNPSVDMSGCSHTVDVSGFLIMLSC